MILRREFLIQSSLLAGAALVFPACVPEEFELNRAGFEARVGTWFHADGEGGVHDLELVEVRDGPVASGLDQFTLIFRGESNGEMGDGTFVMSHPDRADFVLYVEYSGDRFDLPEYCADFSLVL